MHDELPTEPQVRALVPDQIFRRGDRYCERGNIIELATRGGVLHALVAGSEAEPYSVAIAARGDRITVRCDCRYAEDTEAWCKHVVAVLLAVARRDRPVKEQPAVRTLLAPLEREALTALIERMVEYAPRLYAVVRAIAEHGEDGPAVR